MRELLEERLQTLKQSLENCHKQIQTTKKRFNEILLRDEAVGLLHRIDEIEKLLEKAD
jgi:primosomal protein N''